MQARVVGMRQGESFEVSHGTSDTLPRIYAIVEILSNTLDADKDTLVEWEGH